MADHHVKSLLQRIEASTDAICEDRREAEASLRTITKLDICDIDACIAALGSKCFATRHAASGMLRCCPPSQVIGPLVDVLLDDAESRATDDATTRDNRNRKKLCLDTLRSIMPADRAATIDPFCRAVAALGSPHAPLRDSGCALLKVLDSCDREESPVVPLSRVGSHYSLAMLASSPEHSVRVAALGALGLGVAAADHSEEGRGPGAGSTDIPGPNAESGLPPRGVTAWALCAQEAALAGLVDPHAEVRAAAVRCAARVMRAQTAALARRDLDREAALLKAGERGEPACRRPARAPRVETRKPAAPRSSRYLMKPV